jgi:integrase/recombinase XerC
MPAPLALLTEPMQAWLHHLQANRRYSPHTLDGYARDLRHLIALCGDLSPERLSNGHIRQFIARLHGRGLGPRSLARTLATWRGFYQWWVPLVGLPINPTKGVRAPKAARGLPKALSVEQAQALLDHAYAPDTGINLPTTLRDQAMFELLYSSGLRLSELVGLDLHYVRSADYESSGWLNLAESEVVVLGKNGKRRTVPVGAVACAALKKWVTARPALATAQAHPADAAALFVGTRGRRIAPRVVQLQLARLAQAANLPAHVHPHVLRHSCASHLLQSAQDLRAVQEILGHANISTTQIYTRLDFQHLTKVYDQAHPRAGRKPPAK